MYDRLREEIERGEWERRFWTYLGMMRRANGHRALGKMGAPEALHAGKAKLPLFA